MVGLRQDPWMTGVDLSGGPFSLPLFFHRTGEPLNAALRASAPCLLERATTLEFGLLVYSIGQ